MRSLGTVSVRGVLVALMLATVGLASCSDPLPPDGAIICSASSTCPVGYQCAQNHCYQTGHAPAPLNGCDDYCNCMTAACTGRPMGFNSEGECLAACAMLSKTNLDCRIAHCIYAQFGFPGLPPDPDKHCPHAAGASPCDKM